jgi:hypothetical protein
MLTLSRVGLLSLKLMSVCLYLLASDMASSEELSCSNISDSKQRLDCYDAANNQSVVGASTGEQFPAPRRSYLTRSWDLDRRDDELLGEKQSPLQPHRGTYLIVRRSNAANNSPSTPTHLAPSTPRTLLEVPHPY